MEKFYLYSLSYLHMYVLYNWACFEHVLRIRCNIFLFQKCNDLYTSSVRAYPWQHNNNSSKATMLETEREDRATVSVPNENENEEIEEEQNEDTEREDYYGDLIEKNHLELVNSIDLQRQLLFR